MIEDIDSIKYCIDLFSEFLQNYSCDDNLLLYLQIHLVLQGISYKFVKNRIDISRLPITIINKIRKYVEPGKCYHNAEVACKFLDGAKYVFGYWCIDSPIEHAWIRHGNRYYDPSYQITLNKTGERPKAYYPVVELTIPELNRLKSFVSNREQPDLKSYFKSLKIAYTKIVT